MSALAELHDCPETDDPSSTAELEGPFSGIYREHFTLVWRGLRRLGVPDAALEDAVQDVFLVAHRRLDRFARRSSLRTWIFGIVVRVAKDYRRAESRHSRRIASLTEAVSADPSPPRTPADEAERREAGRILYSVLATLEEELREVLVLVELEELPMRDAAAVLGVRVRTCQRRLRAAHTAFEAALAVHLNESSRIP